MGQWLNQFVANQLLAEFRNYRDDFMGVLPGAPKAAITADGLRYNKLINNVQFLVNNTADFTPTKMNGQKVFVEWEKYDTTPTEVDDKEIRSLSYDKRGIIRIKHTDSFKIGIRDHVLWKLTPEDNSKSEMPVILTSGETTSTGRKRLIFKNLAEYLEQVKSLNLLDLNSLYMVLCPEHVTDLILCCLFCQQRCVL